MIEHIEELAAQLHAHSLGCTPGFHERKIPVPKIRSAKSIASRVTKTSERRLSKHLLNRNRTTGREVRYRAGFSYDIPPIAELTRQARVILKVDAAERSASLNRHDRVHLPTLEQLCPGFDRRQVIRQRECESLANIEIAR